MKFPPFDCLRLVARILVPSLLALFLSGCYDEEPYVLIYHPNVTHLTGTSATLSAASGTAVSYRHFEYRAVDLLPGESMDPIRVEISEEDALASLTLTQTITGLSPGRRYYFRMVLEGETRPGANWSRPKIVTGTETMYFTFGMPQVTSPTLVPLTATSATLGGTVVDEGASPVIERGIIMVRNDEIREGDGTFVPNYHLGELPDPRVEEGGYFRKILSSGGEGVFSVDFEDLDPGRTYTFRAYATNSYDTAYSEAYIFTAGAPTVTSPTVGALTPTSAMLDAEVTDEGAGPITFRGFVVSPLREGLVRFGSPRNPNALSFPVSGTTGVFTVNATPLIFSSDYVCYAYAVNEFGVTYSDIIPFTLPLAMRVLPPTVADVTPITATLGATVVSEDGVPITERGILISSAWSFNHFEIGDPGVTKIPTSGTTGLFTLAATDLEPGTVYGYRGYAINSNGIQYSTIKAFETPGNPVVGEVSLISVGQSTVTLEAEVISEGSSALTDRGVLLAPVAVNSAPTIGGEGVIQVPSGAAVGLFTVDAVGLEAETEYAVCAYATNAVGTAYGDTLEFTTLETDSADGADGEGNPAGGVDTLFTGSLAGSEPFSKVNATAVQPDGKTLLVGRFSQVNGVARSNIARLNADGTLDTEFTASVSSEASCVAVLPDGKILIGGQFWSSVNGVNQGSLARLNADGTLDATFAANVQGWILAMVPQPDGKILIGGTIFQLDGSVFNSSIARLNADGGLDVTFGGTTDYGYVSALALQQDGKILVSGVFSSLNNDSNYGRFGRFNSDGTLDTDFIPGVQPNVFPNGAVEVIALQPDGKILIGGLFSSYQGVENAGLARLYPNGVLDESFHAGPRENSPFVRSLALQADGKILVGGDFKRFGGKAAKNIVRLSRDGTLDRSFNTGAGADSFVHSVALQADGRILVAGEFQHLNGHPAALLGRLENGLATSSLQPVGATGATWLLDGSAPEVVGNVLFEVSTDERVSWTPLGAGVAMTGGWSLDGLSLPAVGWLRVSGATHGGLGNGSAGRIEQMEGFPARLPLVTNPSAVLEKNPLRATVGGTVASEGDRPVIERGVVFSTKTINDSPMLGGEGVSTIIADTAGAGAFTVVLPNLVEGVSVSCRAYAISARGTAYSDVVTVLAPRPPTVSIAGVAAIGETSVTMFADLEADPGAIVLDRGFVYTTVAGGDRLGGGANLIRVSVPGLSSLFETSITGLMPGTQYWFAAYVESDLGMVYSPGFSRFITTAPAPEEMGLQGEDSLGDRPIGIAAMPPVGEVDTDYDPDVDAGDLYVQALATQPDGRTIVAGLFSGIGGEPRFNVARLNADGTLDATFTPETNGMVFSAVVQDDGKILLGGLFTSINGQTRNGIARLNADGTVESLSTFNPGTGADNVVYAIALQPDGKILIGGLFQNYNGAPRSHIARLNADGTLESATTFNPGNGADGAVYSVGLQADGKILLGGDFLNVNGTGRTRLARLLPNGNLDPTFDPLTGANDKVSCVLAQPDGQILVGGYFTSFGGSTANRLARLDPDGHLESTATFDPGLGADHRVYSMTLQMDGKILIGGLFQTINDTPRSRVARLNEDGSLDSSFDPGTGADGEVAAIALEADGGILIGGQFTLVDGIPRSHIARYGNDIATGTLNVVDAAALQWTRSGPGPQVSAAVFQLSTDGGLTWRELGSGTREGNDWDLTGIALPPTGIVRVVGRSSGGMLGASSGLVASLATLALTPSEIAVEQLGSGVVANGGTVDMGESVAGSHSKRTLVIRNNGNGLLAGITARLDGLDAGEFSVVSAPTSTVSAGSSTQLTLRFAPADLGPKTARLHVASNDPSTSSFVIELTGNGIRGTHARLGDTLHLDLSWVDVGPGETMRVLGLPPGLVFNAGPPPAITGTALGPVSASGVTIQVTSGRTIVQSIPLDLYIAPYQPAGSYEVLLEDGGLPVGKLKLTIASPSPKTPNPVYTATLLRLGEAQRSTKGSITPGASPLTVSLVFPAFRTFPAVTYSLVIDNDSDLVSGATNPASSVTARGFRLARAGRIPGGNPALTLSFPPTIAGDRSTTPGGIGYAKGSVNSKALIPLSGLLGDAQAFTASLCLSQTNQAVVWLTPYKNKTSYLGGIIDIGMLNVPGRNPSTESATAGLKWLRVLDTRATSYPDGFGPLDLNANTSRWFKPANAEVFAASLGLESRGITVSYFAPTADALPTRWSLRDNFTFLPLLPTNTVTFTGKALGSNGTFSGKLQLPAPAKVSAMSGVFLQDASFDALIGQGLIKVPITAPVKGSFQTLGLDLEN